MKYVVRIFFKLKFVSMYFQKVDEFLYVSYSLYILFSLCASRKRFLRMADWRKGILKKKIDVLNFVPNIPCNTRVIKSLICQWLKINIITKLWSFLQLCFLKIDCAAPKLYPYLVKCKRLYPGVSVSQGQSKRLEKYMMQAVAVRFNFYELNFKKNVQTENTKTTRGRSFILRLSALFFYIYMYSFLRRTSSTGLAQLFAGQVRCIILQYLRPRPSTLRRRKRWFNSLLRPTGHTNQSVI